MRNKLCKGLAALALAGTMTFNNCAPERQMLNNNYSASVNNLNMNKDKYKAEGVVFFDKEKSKEGYYSAQNKDINEGELPFVLTPQNETDLIFDYNRGTDISGKEYIPTMSTIDGKILTKFRITDPEVKAKLSKKLKEKSRITSKNSFGHTFELNEKDIKAILPEVQISGEDYAYVKAYQGNFIYETEGKTNECYFEANKDRLNLLLIPTNQEFKVYTNLKTGEMILETQKIYNPVTKNIQEEIGKKMGLEKSVQTPNKKTESPDEYINYQVQKGDTEWSISEKFLKTGKNYIELEKANPGLNPKNLKEGQIIKIPLK